MVEISGSRSLHQLIYFSRIDSVLMQQTSELQTSVDQIVKTSIRNNRAVAVTGILLVHQKWFVQALEGPANAVMTTYGRICNDRRHEEPQIIFAGPAPARLFGEWNMCARSLNSQSEAVIKTLDLKGAFNPKTFSRSQALNLLCAVGGILSKACA